nr:MAG TPA: tail tape measure [Caudoviricetes sp.]
MANNDATKITTFVGIEGEREYKKALSEIAQEMRVTSSEAKALTATYADNADSLEALQAKDEQLRKELNLLQQRLAVTEQAYESARDTIDDNGKSASEWAVKMNNARADIINQERAIRQNNEAMQAAIADTNEYGESISDLRAEAMDKLDKSLSVIKSKLDLQAATYRDDAKSVEALTAKGKLLNEMYEYQRTRVDELAAQYDEAVAASGKMDAATLSLEDELTKAQTALQNAKNAVDDNAAALEEAQAPTDELAEKTKALEANSGKLGDTVTNMADKIGIVLPENAKKATDALNLVDGSTIALVGTSVKLVKGLMDCSVAAAKNADSLITLSSQTGLSVERLQELQYASELVDVSIDQIADALKSMIGTMKDATSGTGDAAEAYKRLGVRVTDAQGNLRDSNEVFEEIIRRLSEVKNPTERAALAMKIFGEEAGRLNPLIEDGGKKLKQLSKEAHDMGYVMSDETVSSLGALDDAMQRFDNTSEAVKNQMALALLPVLTSVLNIITAIPPGVLSTVTVAVTLITTIAAAAKALKTITSITDLFGISATRTLGTILAVVAALIALSAIIAVIAGKGNDLNRAMSSVGNAVGSVQGNVQKAQKTIPRYASGTDFHPGGWALVGENGPEAVMLPRGTRVYTAQETARMGGGDVYNISINADNVKQFVDIVRIAQSERRSMRMG